MLSYLQPILYLRTLVARVCFVQVNINIVSAFCAEY